MACEFIKSGIKAVCDTSLGGIKKVWLADFKGGIEESVSEAGVRSIDLSAFVGTPEDFKTFTFRKGSSSMTETLNVDDANGVSYISTEIQLQFPKMDSHKFQVMCQLIHSGVRAVVLDANDTYHLLGVNEEIQMTAAEGATGAARGDSNHYSLTLQDNSINFPYVYDKGSSDWTLIDDNMKQVPD